MEILIAGHRVGSLQELIARRPGELDALIITNADSPFPEGVEGLVRESLWMRFDDILQSRGHYQAPESHHVARVLEWGKGRDHVVVACHAGVSRSSASAVLLAYQESGDLERAFAVLDQDQHWPNALILRLGSELLDAPELWRRFVDWHNDALRRIEDDEPTIESTKDVEYL